MQRPEIQKITRLKMTRPNVAKLDNRIPVSVIHLGDQPVSRIDIIIEGGRCDGSSQLESELLAAMLREGTTSLSAKEIAEKLDFYGSWLSCDASTHNITLSLYAVNKHFDKVVPILADIAMHPSIPEHELNNLKSRAANRLLTNNQKVSYLASRTFSNRYFGDKHNLGQEISEEAICGITSSRLQEFHRKWFIDSNVRILISGFVTEGMLQTLNKSFGTSWTTVPATSSRSDSPNAVFCPATEIVDKSNALQSAIKIGIPTIQRNHRDYIPLRILTTALGGYFGSRLMANIREDKGFTYGISASLLGYRNNSIISISSQCATEYTWDVVKEIKHEMKVLQDSRIPKDELDRVRSYMLSELARTLDTPFSIADYYSSVLNNHIDENYFDNQIEIINSISAEEINRIAADYFDIGKMLTVIAGDKQALNRL